MKFNWRQQGSWAMIALVFLVTIYQILPTIVYYLHPLEAPLSEAQATSYYHYQVDSLMKKTSLQEAWIKTFCKNWKLGASIKQHEKEPQLLVLSFSKEEQKATFEKYFPAAAQLSVSSIGELWIVPSSHPKESLVALPNLWTAQDLNDLVCSYTPTFKKEESGSYQQALQTWSYEIVQALQADPSAKGAPNIASQLANLPVDQWNPSVMAELARVYESTTLTKAYQERKLKFLLQGDSNPSETLTKLQAKLTQYQAAVTSQVNEQNDQRALLKQIQQTQAWLNTYSGSLQKVDATFSSDQLATYVKEKQNQEVTLPFTHPLVRSIRLSADHRASLQLQLHNDLESLFSKSATSEGDKQKQQALTAKLYDLMAFLQQAQLGTGVAAGAKCTLTLDPKEHTYWLTVDLAPLMAKEASYLESLIALWQPQEAQLQPAQFKIFTAEQYLDPSTSSEDKLLCLILDPKGLIQRQGETTTDYPRVIFKGFELLTQNAEQKAGTPLQADIGRLAALLQSRGYRFFGIYGSEDKQWQGAAVFASVAPFQSFLSAMNGWQSIGSGEVAFLGIENYATWAAQVNAREDDQHKELVKWHEDWRLASSDMNPLRQALAVKPPINLFWNNLSLSWSKLLRGDSKRVIKWGLDLSGGRSVRLAIFDSNHQRVTAPDMLIQTRNELIQRVNRIGLSEVAARIEGEHIVVDFPSSQGYSSKELLQATTMTFQLVNERFCSPTSPLRNDAQEFLSRVWSEALITHREDTQGLCEIARRLLKSSESLKGDSCEKRLLAAGLKIAPADYRASNEFNEEYSSIVMTQVDPKMAQKNPLLIVFTNWALQGSDLTDVRSGYDPQHGNILTFEVSSKGKDQLPPQEAFWKWTSHFSAEQIQGSALEGLTQGRGWRMAVVLSDRVVSSPALSSGLRDRAMIYGQFSPRDVARLSAELKAGSLTFTPQILSEENISPELGQQDRMQGIFASAIAFVSVILAMIAYYRFGGLVASLAVSFNLLIQWAVWQNLGAAITLPGLAGVVLAMGMAVDANVLVFERIREELENRRSLAQAIQAGYARAFSAILDSNLTTILAAFILVQFDSGPIKGFAVTLIIGIISSMFTSLFMTRVFFEAWAKRYPNSTLNMSKLIGRPKLPFLAWFKPFFIVSAALTLVGSALLWQARHHIFGMDFIGGYAFTTSLSMEAEALPKARMIEALESAGLDHTSFDVRELGQTGRVKIFLSRNLDQPGGRFNQMTDNDQRLDWVQEALVAKLKLTEDQIDQIRGSWSSISGQLSQSMRSQAIIGLLLALAGILIYLAIRFEWLFALAGVICLSFDVIVSIAAIGWLRFLGLPMQIDLQAMGAIMTIVGYALNDKIIIFDRIREDRKDGALHAALIQSALSSTLSRTLMTSGTTLLVLLVLDFLGGASLLSFSMIMTIGVAIGTLSSLFIAPAVLLMLAKRLKAEE